MAQELTSSGAVTSWHSWGTFGGQEAGSALGELPSYGYNAEEAHPQTGLQYLRARYYDTSAGRFEVQDSYLGTIVNPLSLNRYLYCLSDPLNLIDPSGYAPSWTRLYNPFTISPADRSRVFQASIGAPTGGQIYVTVPIRGVWHVTETMAWLTTFAGQFNWASIEARRSGYGSSAGYSGSMSYADWYRSEALRCKAELEKFYCGIAEAIRENREQQQKDLELFHLSLSAASRYVPVVFNLENALYYGLEGEWIDAALSAASAVPSVGYISLAGQVIKWLIEESEE